MRGKARQGKTEIKTLCFAGDVESLEISNRWCTVECIVPRWQRRTRPKLDNAHCGNEFGCNAALVPFTDAAPDTGSRVIGKQVINCYPRKARCSVIGSDRLAMEMERL